MTFGISRRTRILKQRGHVLVTRWQKLKRSFAPGPQKTLHVAKDFLAASLAWLGDLFGC